VTELTRGAKKGKIEKRAVKRRGKKKMEEL
jgi:hypothetical protein